MHSSINAEKHRLKVLYVAPHLSTGGMPQFLLKRIELLNDVCDVYCVEYNQIAVEYVVQRNKIIQLLGNKFMSLQDKSKDRLLDIISSIRPDVIHFEEFPETFVEQRICKEIYKPQRIYLIFESFHGLWFKPEDKKVFPDKFLFVSEYQADIYRALNVTTEVIPYPIEYKTSDKIAARKALQFKDGYKHVLHVGLFARWKNQGELIEIARLMQDEKTVFHFVGNLAPNFKDYWDSIVANLPPNCVVWNEREDVHLFYQAADLLVFPSTMETAPLVPREAISWGLPCLLHELPAYKDMFTKYNNVKYLTKDSPVDNVNLIKQMLHLT